MRQVSEAIGVLDAMVGLGESPNGSNNAPPITSSFLDRLVGVDGKPWVTSRGIPLSERCHIEASGCRAQQAAKYELTRRRAAS